MELKSQLRNLKDMSKEQLITQNVDELINNMLNNIGTIDSELRDKLIYTTFVKFIRESIFDKKQLQYIMKTCLDSDHLFYGIGDINSDSVFTRSFSTLIIASILMKDKDVRILTNDDLLLLFEKSNYYLRQENDTRGYVEEKGWAHSIAHGADLLVSLINHPTYNSTQSKEFLYTLCNCLFKGTVYTDDEDERLICIIDALFDKGLEEKELEEWLFNVFSQLEDIFVKEGYSINFFRIKTNVMNFIKTLYFRLGYKDVKGNVRNYIDKNIEFWYRKLN
jgi:hypothetical protein